MPSMTSVEGGCLYELANEQLESENNAELRSSVTTLQIQQSWISMF
jgi:hypothetical protein